MRSQTNLSFSEKNRTIWTHIISQSLDSHHISVVVGVPVSQFSNPSAGIKLLQESQRCSCSSEVTVGQQFWQVDSQLLLTTSVLEQNTEKQIAPLCSYLVVNPGLHCADSIHLPEFSHIFPVNWLRLFFMFEGLTTDSFNIILWQLFVRSNLLKTTSSLTSELIGHGGKKKSASQKKTKTCTNMYKCTCPILHQP